MKMENKGFSLVELIVVIAIMAVLIGIMGPTIVSNVEKAKLSKDKSAADLVYTAFTSTAGDPEINTEIIGKEYVFDISGGETVFPKDGRTLGGKTFGNGDVVTKIAEYLATETITFSSKYFQEGEIHIAVAKSGKVIVWMKSDDSVNFDHDFFINCEDHTAYVDFKDEFD